MKTLILKLIYFFIPWKPVKYFLPKEHETVWLYSKNSGYAWIGSIEWTGDGWLWTVSNGIIYAINRRIIADCEADDDYDVTHFRRLPKLPKKLKK